MVFFLPVAGQGKAVCQIQVSNIKSLTTARNCLRKKASFWERIMWASGLAALAKISVPKTKVCHKFNNCCIQVKTRIFDTCMFENSLNDAHMWYNFLCIYQNRAWECFGNIHREIGISLIGFQKVCSGFKCFHKIKWSYFTAIEIGKKINSIFPVAVPSIDCRAWKFV